MRYDDASQADSHGHSDTIARPDADRLPAGSYGPATGNAITGQGTSSGSSGADSVGSNPATIVAVQGAGGEAIALNGVYQATGQYGALSIDAQGNFSYERNPGTPDGVKDVFNYTIADAGGASSSTTLTIDIGRVAAAAAGQGVVSLPAGVELSDIHVNGRDLIVNMPDGTQMVIPNGAVFVPQIMIGDVEVPATNVAALLVQSEPEPAAGPPPSSGGNWNDAIPDLAPGAAIGDLIPPTELGHGTPVFQEPLQGIDTEPSIVIETPDNPAGFVNASESVAENGLPTRNGGESPGSGEIADGNASNDSDTSETNTGTIVFTAKDGLESVTINDVAVTAVGQQIAGLYGTITITGIDLASGQITYSYTLTDNTSGDTTKDVFTVVVTDHDGDTATGTLTVKIVDDTPTAHDDHATQGLGAPSITVNVVANDVFGADGVTNSHVAYVTGSLSGTGTLVYNNDGTFTYTPGAGEHGIVTYQYSITDGDGDVSNATVTITLTANSIPTVSISGDQSVDEAGLPPHGGLPAGSGEIADSNPNNNSDSSETATGSIDIGTGTDTLAKLEIDAQDVTNGGTVTTPYGTLTVTHNPDGTYSYSYTLADNTDANFVTNDTFHVVVTDNNGDAASTDLVITIADDQPAAHDDIANQTVQNQPITVDVVANDVFGADGVTYGDVAYVTGSLTGAGTLTYNNDGTFTYTPTAGESGTVSFDYTITDGDGDVDQATVTINLTPDTVPSIGAPSNLSVDEDGLVGANADNGQVNPTEANNGGSATDASGSVTVSFGADVPAAPANAIYFINPSALDGQLTQDGQPITFGIDASGHLVGQVNGATVITIAFTATILGAGGDVTSTYKATVSGPVDQALGDQLEAGITLTGIQFQVTDSDGSHAAAPGSFDVTIYDDVPSASNESGSVAEGSVLTGTFDYVAGADGAHVTAIGATTLVYDNTGWSQPVALSNGSSIRVNVSGSYEFTPADPTSGTPTVTGTYTVTDADGDHVTANFSFDVKDAHAPSAGTTSALVDDDGLPLGIGDSAPGDATPSSDPDNNEATFSGTVPHNFGADGAGSITFAAMDGAIGTVGQEDIVYSWDSGTNTLTATVTSGARSGSDLFEVVVNPATGAYTVTLLENVLQLNDGTNTENDSAAALTYTVVDSDGSTANPAGTLNITFDDDVPTLGTIQPLTANDNPAQTASVGSLHLEIGADGFASVTISPDLTGLSSGGHALLGQQTGNVYTAYADVDGDGNVSAADTAVFAITVDPNGGTSGTYTFDLLQALDQTPTPFDIGKGSSFGVGPSQSVVVTDDNSGTNLVFVTGWSPNAGFNNAAWLAGGNPDLTQTSNVNGSEQGWGLANNNFDSGEFLRFDFGGLNDYDGAGGYTPPGSPTIANVSYATFSFFNFGKGDTIEFVAHYTDGTTQNFVLTNGSQSTLTITAPSGADIAWIDAFESNGSIKLNLDQVGVITQTIDKTIDVDMTFTDGDGDSVTGSTTIHVMDGGTATTPNAVVHQASFTSSISTASLVSSNDNSGASDSRTVGQTAALMGALAAAGLQADELRADGHSVSHVGTTHTLAKSVGSAVEPTAATHGHSHATSTNVSQSVHAPMDQQVSHASDHAHNMPDQLHTLGEAHHAAINPLLQQSASVVAAHAPMHGTAVTAAAIAMPSAHQLAAAGADHSKPDVAQHNEVVGKILADSLNGGEGQGANIDAVIDAHAGHGLTLNVAQAIANHAPAPLHFGHVGFSSVFGGHHMETMHHDAAPPAHA